MFYNDYKIPKHIYPLRDTLLNEYLEYQKKLGSNTTNNYRDKSSKAVSGFIYNTGRGFVYKNYDTYIPLRKEFFSQCPIYNGRKVNRKISYKHFRRFLDFLVINNYITLEVGGVDEWELEDGKFIPSKLSYSRVTLLAKLTELYSKHLTKYSVWSTPSVVEVRDNNKNPVEFRSNIVSKKSKECLISYNLKMSEVDIMSGQNTFDVQLKRIFNNSSFYAGGRLYMQGGGSVQTLPEFDRRKVLINGSPTVELDYMSLHPRLAAEIDGITLDSKFDPYQIEMKGYDPIVLRELSKLAVMILMYASEGGYHSAYNSYLRGMTTPTLEELILTDKVPMRIDVKGIFERVLERNPYLSGWIEGEPKAYHLQNLDSEIMLYIIDVTQQRGVDVVPIHDSVLCKAEDEDFTVKVMQYAYREIMKTNNNCVIKNKKTGVVYNSPLQ